MPLLVLLLIVVPVLELFVIARVGDAIGWSTTLGLLLVDSLLGAFLLRHQGRGAWRRFNAALEQGRPPAREVLDGVLVIVGGALLLTPGFITDGVGFLLLVPPGRALVRRTLSAYFLRRFKVAGAAATAAGRAAAGRRPASTREHDVEGTAVEVDEPQLRP